MQHQGGIPLTDASLTPATVFCSGCGAPLGGTFFNSGKEFRCGRCGAKLSVEVFPALFQQPQVQSGERLSSTEEASCFYHPQKKAAAICASCGRFLCTLCETDFAGKCLCPSCIDRGRSGETMEELVTHRALPDSMALSLAILPMLFFPVTVVTAPMALFLAIRYWRRPGSILPRRRIRFVLAILIALGQIVGWGVVLLRMWR
jgi:hypothetical protein